MSAAHTSAEASRSRATSASTYRWTTSRLVFGAKAVTSLLRTRQPRYGATSHHLVSDGHHLHRAARRPVVAALLARRQLDGIVRHVLVWDQGQEVANQVEMRGALVVGLDHVPGRLFDVAVRKHLVLRLGVVDPARSGLQVHWAELPALAGIVDASKEARLLLLIADREPVLDEHDPRAHEHALELRARAHELVVLLVGAEAHHPLDAGPVVPAAVEQHHLARRRQVLNVALEVPLRALFLGGCR